MSVLQTIKDRPVFWVVLSIIVLPSIGTAYPCWIAGVVFSLAAMWVFYRRKSKRLADRKNWSKMVRLSLTGYSIFAWPKNDSLFESFDSDIILPSLAGVIVAFGVGVVWYWKWLPQGGWDIAGIVVSAALVPVPLFLLKPRKYYERWLDKQVNRLVQGPDFDVKGLEELRAIEKSIEKVCAEQGKQPPESMFKVVGKYVDEHQVELITDWNRVFAQFMAERQRISRQFLSSLGGASDKSGDGEKNSSQSEADPTPRRMTRDVAFRILGLSSGATLADVQAARKEAIKKFNVDHRQDLEPHIRDLVEEKFKQVNMAYDFLKAAF